MSAELHCNRKSLMRLGRNALVGFLTESFFTSSNSFCSTIGGILGKPPSSCQKNASFSLGADARKVVPEAGIPFS